MNGIERTGPSSSTASEKPIDPGQAGGAFAESTLEQTLSIENQAARAKSLASKSKTKQMADKGAAAGQTMNVNAACDAIGVIDGMNLKEALTAVKTFLAQNKGENDTTYQRRESEMIEKGLTFLEACKDGFPGIPEYQPTAGIQKAHYSAVYQTKIAEIKANSNRKIKTTEEAHDYMALKFCMHEMGKYTKFLQALLGDEEAARILRDHDTSQHDPHGELGLEKVLQRLDLPDIDNSDVQTSCDIYSNLPSYCDLFIALNFVPLMLEEETMKEALKNFRSDKPVETVLKDSARTAAGSSRCLEQLHKAVASIEGLSQKEQASITAMAVFTRLGQKGLNDEDLALLIKSAKPNLETINKNSEEGPSREIFTPNRCFTCLELSKASKNPEDDNRVFELVKGQYGSKPGYKEFLEKMQTAKTALQKAPEDPHADTKAELQTKIKGFSKKIQRAKTTLSTLPEEGEDERKTALEAEINSLSEQMKADKTTLSKLPEDPKKASQNEINNCRNAVMALFGTETSAHITTKINAGTFDEHQKEVKKVTIESVQLNAMLEVASLKSENVQLSEEAGRLIATPREGQTLQRLNIPLDALTEPINEILPGFSDIKKEIQQRSAATKIQAHVRGFQARKLQAEQAAQDS